MTPARARTNLDGCPDTPTLLRVVQGTVYATQTYAISLSFPPTYPYAPPTVKFETPCFRPFSSSSSQSITSSSLTRLTPTPDPNVALTGDICLGTPGRAFHERGAEQEGEDLGSSSLTPLRSTRRYPQGEVVSGPFGLDHSRVAAELVGRWVTGV